MRKILNSRIWTTAQTERKRQKCLGWVSGVLLAIALVALFDGLLAQMRTGTNELNILPGQGITLSGPAVLKNPLNSDVLARFNPADAPLSFELEGFFTGYWFGNGMWRGQVRAAKEAGEGSFSLRIAFRGASAQTAQNYVFNVYENAEAMREASLSIFRRWFNINPFLLAATCGILGILTGLATYFFGRRYALCLATLGLAEIARASEADGGIWCLSPRNVAPLPGNVRMILDTDGSLIGEARCGEWHKGRLHLTMLDGNHVPAGALVCLTPPAVSGYEMENRP